ncbi:MscS Mechanosensitive ion channel [Richelia sinica FACHB-800]|uniref:MscS Mechanosensitive ion channel n=1 Tax=Richelia sinica FACHB-800 TaxID=1357546 RepID=A0A975T746_9NOST|nr:MscS Mechanosensitive ion channel [Richelia sinica FACHB-800]
MSIPSWNKKSKRQSNQEQKINYLPLRLLPPAFCLLTLAAAPIPKATAQIPLLPPLQPANNINNQVNNQLVSDWVYLDGRPLFAIAASKSNLPERLQNIRQNLRDITHNYLQVSTNAVNVNIKNANGLPVIYVNDQYLMTITYEDAGQGNPLTLANQISNTLQKDLSLAKQERQTQFLIQQSQIAAAGVVTMLVLSWGLRRWQKRLSHPFTKFISAKSPVNAAITTQLNQQQQQHLQEVKKRLFQLGQAGIWGSGSFFILGLFPYTRALQAGILAIAQIPIKLTIVALGTYLAVRFTYALIDHFTSTIVSSGALLTPETSERLQLRVSTFSGVTKSIATIVCGGTGILLALISLGIDVVPLLAGAGLVGVAVSLASQNLIKDAINGFLIILEDQYALGDVISVGNVGGLVENLNLRMTQVRDSEGRLITIPNSEIKVVANLSSRWSRADLTVPVSYQADVNEALDLIETVALEMNQEPKWQRQILEKPNVLGIEQFGDYGLSIRVWIKTQPLKQWEVAREYRRRLKVALDEAGIHIPVPQQVNWITDIQQLNSQGSGT